MDAVTLLGLAAACCTTISFVPQAFKTIQTKDTSGISLSMYTLFTLGSFLWLLYGIWSSNIPVTVANGITSILASIILIYKIRFR